jgi:acetate kinase
VDPGLVIWLLEHVRMPPAELASTLEHRSGLLGLAGTPDMRSILASADAGDPAATLARDVYVHRLRAAIASMTAAMGGLDVLLFTGGVGEHAPAIRALAADGLGYLGVVLDVEANAAAVPDAVIGRQDAAVRALVIRAREDLEIAHEVRAVLRAT